MHGRRGSRFLVALWLVAAQACSSHEEDTGTAGTGGASPDGGGAGAGGKGGLSAAKAPFTAGAPVDAPDMTWTYVAVPGTACRDGVETGFGININPDSDKLIIYMEGGGACFNTLTCLANPRAWGESNLGTPGGVLRRDPSNPFHDWNLVYIPYCTGDVYSGSAGPGEGYNGEPQQGYVNVGLYLERIVPTFPDLAQVVLSGSSAGGFGVSWNGLRAQDAFGDIPVHVLDDSGPPLGPEQLSPCMQQRLGEMWGWAKTIHPACEECDIAAGNVVVPLIELALERASEQRFGVLSYDEDGVIKTFLGYGLNDCAQFNPALFGPSFPAGLYGEGLEGIRQRAASYDNFALFEVSGGGHTFLGGDLSQTTSGGVTLLDWVTAFRDGSDAFLNVQP